MIQANIRNTMMIVGVFYLLALNWFLVAVSCSESDRSMHEGKLQLERVWSLAAQPKYGDCWTKALEDINSRCQELTADQQSRIALKFAHCHLQRSGRPFPPCPEGAEVSSCTGKMDVVAFNAYTEFFTHTHSMCHFLQSEAWQHRAHLTMHRLSESSVGVAEQLESTRQMAEDIVEAQSATLLAQEDILRNGQELKHTLVQSTEDVRSVFSQMTDSSREQHVMMSELFNRMSFLHNFLLTETHSLSSVLFNAAALCLSFLLTATARTARARFVLLVLVCLNIYLERLIYQKVLDSDRPSHQHMESVSVYVCMLRKSIVCVSVLALVYAFVRYRDPVQESLELLSQLRQTHSSLQLSLKQAERRSLSASREGREAEEDRGGEENLSTQRKGAERRGGERILRRTGELMAYNLSMITADSSIDQSQLSHSGMLSSTLNTSENTLLCPDIASSILVHDNTTHNSTLHSLSTRNAAVSPGRRGRRSSCVLSSSPVVYSVPVDKRRGEERKGGQTTEERSETREKERDEDGMLILARNAAVSPGRRGRRSASILPSSSSPVIYSVPVEKRRGEDKIRGEMQTTEERSRRTEKERDEDAMLMFTHRSPGRRGRRTSASYILPSSSSSVVYNVLVDKKPRYSLRSRTSLSSLADT